MRIRPDVSLVPLTVEHASQMYGWMCDPTVSRNLGLRSEPSLEKTVVWIQNALQDPLIRPFAVLLNGQHVGNVVLDRIDRHLGSTRLSVYIGEPSARQSGVGRTAIHLVLREAFGGMSLHKVWLTVHAGNYRAINTYLSLGFVLEGILRDEFWYDGRRTDVLYMGLLHQEFEQLVVG